MRTYHEVGLYVAKDSIFLRGILERIASAFEGIAQAQKTSAKLMEEHLATMKEGHKVFVSHCKKHDGGDQ